MWSYNPVTEEEIGQIQKEFEEERVWPDGIYNFEVLDFKSFVSEKSNNQVIKLVLRIFHPNGKHREQWDWLVNTKSMQFKTKHFCDTTGLAKVYQDKAFRPEMVLGKSGKVILGSGKNDKGEKVNRVVDYQKVDVSQDKPFNDEIPF